VDAGEYLEAAVRDVLTADESTVDDRVGYAALLLASAGAAGESDRLITHWHALTERPVTALVTGRLRARAWAMLFEARGRRPEWAAGLSPLDLDAEERSHTASVRKPVVPPGIVNGVVERIMPSRPDPAREALAASDLGAWAEHARGQQLPDVATLAATRQLAAHLVAGADPLGVSAQATGIASALIAALYERYPQHIGSWPDLVTAILRLRGDPRKPKPATVFDIDAAERRIGLRLPADFRDFLLTADGLPADVVFPRLLGAGELRAEGQVVIVSDPVTVLLARAGDGWRAMEVDPVLGTTVHQTFRRLLEHHLVLLAQSA